MNLFVNRFFVLSPDLIENLLTLSPSLAAPLVVPTSPFLPWLFARLALADKPAEWDQNRYYAAEMMSLVLSLPEQVVANANAVRQGRMRLADDKEGGLEGILKILSVSSSLSLSCCWKKGGNRTRSGK